MKENKPSNVQIENEINASIIQLNSSKNSKLKLILAIMICSCVILALIDFTYVLIIIASLYLPLFCWMIYDIIKRAYWKGLFYIFIIFVLLSIFENLLAVILMYVFTLSYFILSRFKK